MDFQRLFLFLIFSFSVLLLWDGWQRAQHPPVQVAATAASSPAATSTVPSAPEMSVKPKLSPAEQLAKVTSASKVGKKLHVTTDLLSVDINTIGGDIHHLEFLKRIPPCPNGGKSMIGEDMRQTLPLMEPVTCH